MTELGVAAKGKLGHALALTLRSDGTSASSWVQPLRVALGDTTWTRNLTQFRNAYLPSKSKALWWVTAPWRSSGTHYPDGPFPASHNQRSACVFSCLLLSLFQGSFPGSSRRLLKYPGLCSPSDVSNAGQESGCTQPDFLCFWRAEASWSASFIHALVVMPPFPGIAHLLLLVRKFCCLVCFSSHIS